MLSPPLFASANPTLCPLPTIWFSLPAAAIQLSHPKLPQHYSIPDLLCLVAQCLLRLFFILAVGKTPLPLRDTVMSLSSLHPHHCSHRPFSLSLPLPWVPLNLTPFLPLTAHQSPSLHRWLQTYVLPVNGASRSQSETSRHLPQVSEMVSQDWATMDLHVFAYAPYETSRPKPKALSRIKPTNTF